MDTPKWSDEVERIAKLDYETAGVAYGTWEQFSKWQDGRYADGFRETAREKLQVKVKSAHAVRLTFDSDGCGVKLIHTGLCDQTANHEGECVLGDWVENLGDELVQGETTFPVKVEWLNDNSPSLTLVSLEQHHVLALLGAIRSGAAAEDDDLLEALNRLRASLPALD